MSVKSVEETLKNFYSYKLQHDDSRTARLYLNTAKTEKKVVLLAKGYSSQPSVSISHEYNGSVGNPNDLAHHTNEALKGVVGKLQEKYSEIQNILKTADAFKTLLFPDNTALSKVIGYGQDISDSLYSKLKPYLSIYESRQASYEESRGYTNTNFSLQPSLSIVLYPKLIEEEDLAVKYYYNKSVEMNKILNRMISPASQLKTLLRFLTGRTEYYSINVNTTKEQNAKVPSASENGETLYIPNPFTGGNTGFGISTDVSLANKEKGSGFVRYRRILPPNGYSPDSTSFNYGLEGTFRLVVGGIERGEGDDKIKRGAIDTKGYAGTSTDIYGAATRSSTGSNFYDNLLISGISIANSDTVIKMKSFDMDSLNYLDEVTPEYITLNISFEHAYAKYDFNELYWALGLSSLEDMQSLNGKSEAFTSTEYDPNKVDKVDEGAKTESAEQAGNDVTEAGQSAE